jgi:hypothetical protein
MSGGDLLFVLLLVTLIRGQELCEIQNLIGRCVDQPNLCPGLAVDPQFSPCANTRACCLPGNCRQGAMGAGFCRTNDSQCTGPTVAAAQAKYLGLFFFFFFFFFSKGFFFFFLSPYFTVVVKHSFLLQACNKLFAVFPALRQ